MEEKKKRKRPSVKQKAFADALLTGKAKTLTAAAKIAKYSSPSKDGSRAMSLDTVREYMMDKFHKYGINDDTIARKMSEGMDAMAPPRKEGGTRYEDQFTRRLYLDMYFRLRGLYAPEKTEHVEKRIVINMTQEFMKGLIDAGAVKQEELDYIEGEVIHENT